MYEISPGNAQLLSRLCLPHIHLYLPCKYWTLEISDSSSDINASYVISVRQTNVLPEASFRFRFATDTLALKLTIPLTGLVGDFHSLAIAPCRAHLKKRLPFAMKSSLFLLKLSVSMLLYSYGRS